MFRLFCVHTPCSFCARPAFCKRASLPGLGHTCFLHCSRSLAAAARCQDGIPCSMPKHRANDWLCNRCGQAGKTFYVRANKLQCPECGCSKPKNVKVFSDRDKSKDKDNGKDKDKDARHTRTERRLEEALQKIKKLEAKPATPPAAAGATAEEFAGADGYTDKIKEKEKALKDFTAMQKQHPDAPGLDKTINELTTQLDVLRKQQRAAKSPLQQLNAGKSRQATLAKKADKIIADLATAVEDERAAREKADRLRDEYAKLEADTLTINAEVAELELSISAGSTGQGGALALETLLESMRASVETDAASPKAPPEAAKLKEEFDTAMASIASQLQAMQKFSQQLKAALLQAAPPATADATAGAGIGSGDVGTAGAAAGTAATSTGGEESKMAVATATGKTERSIEELLGRPSKIAKR